MSHDAYENGSDYSFGSMPSPEVRQLDHNAWWAAFMSLVGTMPRKAEASRLSDDPVHVVHGQYFSIRDCAKHAIDAAYAENFVQVAHDYEMQAKNLIFSFDKRVYIRVSRVFDRQRLKYLVICTACMLFGVVLVLIYSSLGKKSNGLVILIVLSVLLAGASAILAALTTWHKRIILYHSKHPYRSEEPEISQQQ